MEDFLSDNAVHNMEKSAVNSFALAAGQLLRHDALNTKFWVKNIVANDALGLGELAIDQLLFPSISNSSISNVTDILIVPNVLAWAPTPIWTRIAMGAALHATAKAIDAVLQGTEAK